MIFIDALNCGGGGAKTLLRSLQEKLTQNGPVRFLVNDSVSIEGDNAKVFRKLLPFSSKRTAVLFESLRNHSSATLLCLGNIPPPTKVHSGRTITYFHNALIIGSLRRNALNSIESLRFHALEHFVRRFARNTDEWIVQTDYIKEHFCDYFQISSSSVSVIPFFDEPEADDQFSCLKRDNDFVYVSSAASHKNHARLFKAWEVLAAQHGYTPSLTITIDNWNRNLKRLYLSAKAVGANIIDVGVIAHIEVRQLLHRSRWCIYPSMVETIGLGLLESAQCGCGVICSNTGFADEVIGNFQGFDPFSVDQIVATVLSTRDQNISAATPKLKPRYDLLFKKLV